ncbi:MAG: hypothetical protein J6M54_04220, partial [Prevotella sp.]|nr:hypothetical protein [Prevotella sp.]
RTKGEKTLKSFVISELPLFTQGLRFYPKLQNKTPFCKQSAVFRQRHINARRHRTDPQTAALFICTNTNLRTLGI